jgi:hypothetical protein
VYVGPAPTTVKSLVTSTTLSLRITSRSFAEALVYDPVLGRVIAVFAAKPDE